MASPTFEGTINGCPATLSVGEESVHLSVSLPLSEVSGMRVMRNCVLLQSSSMPVPFDTLEAVAVGEQLRLRIPDIVDNAAPAPAAPKPQAAPKRRRLRR